MKVTQLSSDTLDRAQERFLECLKEMSLAEINTMPEPLIKSVTWLVWHSARVLDYQISPLMETEQVYFSQGWKEKFDLDLPDDTKDWKHSPEEAAKVVVEDKNLLIAYLETCMDLAKGYLATLDETSMDEIVDRSWTPAVTRQVRLVSTIDDVVMHSGQAVYTRRLVLGK
ncbi:DinB family protein [Streptococcus didelphis]|uniref:DinB family protein n=1 Tax=Streptococcus didelphis TaxID=102886 RepID=A0ABY9LGH1_9STRE|nr:DinB family protein [Streptococcus didelphis]WMB27934.1 DinB family protein [Streptococcus didelphis]WMB29598.1 DinB family protein [Streptococcus didelphis]